MAYADAFEANKAIHEALGFVDGRYQDVVLFFQIQEIHSHQSAWRSKPTGKFQVNLPPIHRGGREKVMRTRANLNNTFDMEAIKEHLDQVAKNRKAEAESTKARMQNKMANLGITERVKAAYNGKSYLTDFKSDHFNSIRPSVDHEGMVNITWHKAMTEAQAMKFIAFINKLEAE